MKKWAGVPIEIHAHNDFGLGAANSLTAVEAGVAAMFSYRMHKEGLPLGPVPYLLELVGGTFGIVLGKKAGMYNVLWHLERTGRQASEEAIRGIVDQVKAKSIEERRMITDDEFDAIYNEVVSGS